MNLARIVALAPVGSEAVHLRFADGATGTLDLADLRSRGGVFATLTPEGLTIAQDGRAVVWTDPDGDEADIDADTLRRTVADDRAAA